MREYKLILRAIDHFRLNLNGLTVLTEAASGNYKWCPLIAAKAGAKVIAFTKNSGFGSARTIRSEINYISGKFKLSRRIKIVTKLTRGILKSADIITNSGFLRPLDKNKLKHCKDTAVIPLMWETWEYREKDLDIAYCHKKGIPVLGTNESYRYLSTISYLGAVVKKILFEANIEVYKCNFAIVGIGKFAKQISRSLASEGASCFNVTKFGKKEKTILRKCDALIIADHETDTRYIGTNSKITGKEIKGINEDIAIIHISGYTDPKDLRANGIKYYPEKIASLHYMSVGTDHAGPKPLLDLYAAGLKVAEILSRKRLQGVSYEKSISDALKNKLCQDFSKHQKKLYYSRDVNNKILNN